MSFRCPRAAGLPACLAVVCALAVPAPAAERTLRVCADPNNLPFSNERGEGLENRLAEMVARDIGAKLQFVWWSERQSLVKNTLDSGRCDALMGAPAMLDEVALTRPYYRSSYVFVSRRDRNLALTSLNDPRLEKLRIGIHVVGGDYAPPGHALAQRGLARNIVPYSLFGAFGEENPPARIVEAVERGDIDVAIVWGPFAGYFAKRQSAALDISPVSPSAFGPIPFTYDFAIAVRKGNEQLRRELDDALGRQCPAVQTLLADFGVPLTAREGGPACDSPQASQSASSR